jgi:hypothetical protein
MPWSWLDVLAGIPDPEAGAAADLLSRLGGPRASEPP